MRTSPGRRTLTFPFSGGLATTAATRAGRLLEASFAKRSGTNPDTILFSGAGNSKRMLLSLGDIPGFTTHDIHIRCPTLKAMGFSPKTYDPPENKRIREAKRAHADSQQLVERRIIDGSPLQS